MNLDNIPRYLRSVAGWSERRAACADRGDDGLMGWRGVVVLLYSDLVDGKVPNKSNEP